MQLAGRYSDCQAGDWLACRRLRHHAARHVNPMFRPAALMPARQVAEGAHGLLLFMTVHRSWHEHARRSVLRGVDVSLMTAARLNGVGTIIMLQRDRWGVCQDARRAKHV